MTPTVEAPSVSSETSSASVSLHATSCAICETLGNAVELYPANFSEDAFNAAIFSARRLPDRVHGRIVRCDFCGLVRSDPTVDTEVLARLYAQSSFDYGDEISGLQKTYGKYLRKLKLFGGQKGSLLEIGCGNGFFLQEAKRQGYKIVRGVEPSTQACDQAPRSVKANIVCDIMRTGVFEPDSFDAICLFQVFDHIPEPNALLQECFSVLKPGGLILFLNHNVNSVSAKLLGAKSPIIDLEHTYLYSPRTLMRITQKHGFRVRSFGAVWNIYSLHYLVRLLPLPSSFKKPLLRKLQQNAIGKIQFPAPLGNLYLIAQKPKP
jgi:SAM-dependent methyltransferase